MPNTPPSSRIMLLVPAALPTDSSANRADHRVLGGRDRHRDADAGDDQRHQQLRVGDAGLGDQRDPGHPAGLDQQAADHQRPLADPVGQRAGDRGDQNEGAGPRHQPQPGVERAVAQAGLQQLREEEDRAEQRARRRRRSPRCRPRTPASGRSASGASAPWRAAPRRRRPTASSDADRQRRRRPRALPQPAELPRTRPQTIPSAPPVTSAEARGSRGRCRGRSSPRIARQHERDGEQADRDVEPEDPGPVDALDDGAADKGPLATASPVIALKMPIAVPRRSGGKAALEQRQAERHHERRAHALDARGRRSASRRRARARWPPRRPRTPPARRRRGAGGRAGRRARRR